MSIVKFKGSVYHLTDYVPGPPIKLEFVHVWNMGMKCFDLYKPSSFPYYDLSRTKVSSYCFGWNEI